MNANIVVTILDVINKLYDKREFQIIEVPAVDGKFSSCKHELLLASILVVYSININCVPMDKYIQEAKWSI